MKILITGGAGFIGSHLTDKLLEKGHIILVLDNYLTTTNYLSEQKNLTIVRGSVSDELLVNKAFRDFSPDTVVHAAASYKDPDNWYEDVQSNVTGTIHIIRACQSNGVKRLIYLQTSLCYGLKPLQQPITLEHPLLYGDPFGITSYAISKTAAEQYIKNSGLDFISFRLANVYGPGNITGPAPAFYTRLTEGKPCTVVDTKRDFIYIDDVADCILKAIDGKGKKGIYHISTGHDHSIKELFDLMVEYLQIQLKEAVQIKARGSDDVYTILIDPSKTEEEFGWKAKTSLETGIKKTIDWYKKNNITQTFTHLKNIN